MRFQNPHLIAYLAGSMSILSLVLSAPTALPTTCSTNHYCSHPAPSTLLHSESTLVARNADPGLEGNAPNGMDPASPITPRSVSSAKTHRTLTGISETPPVRPQNKKPTAAAPSVKTRKMQENAAKILEMIANLKPKLKDAEKLKRLTQLESDMKSGIERLKSGYKLADIPHVSKGKQEIATEHKKAGRETVQTAKQQIDELVGKNDAPNWPHI